MAALINTVYPSYNDTSNYSGVNSAIKSAGIVTNPGQAETVIGLEREGRLGLSQFGFIKLPREVLFLQDERSAKVKGTQVASSTASDMDEDRLLKKVEDSTSTTAHAVSQKPDQSGKDQTEDNSAANNGTQGAQNTSGNAASGTQDTAADDKNAQNTSGFLAQASAATGEADKSKDFQRKDGDKDKSRGASSAAVSKLLGQGSDVYQGVISASHGSLSGRNLSILA